MMAMAVLAQPYTAKVHEKFWFREIRQAVGFLQSGGTFAELKVKSEEQNFFNASSASRADEIRRVTERRLKTVTPSFYTVFQESSLSLQKVLVIFLILLTDHTFYRFMDDCFREKVQNGDRLLYNRDFLRVFRAIQNGDSKAAAWTDATLVKMRANYKAMLREAGLIAGTKEPYTIQRPLLSQTIHEYLLQEGLIILERIVTGESRA